MFKDIRAPGGERGAGGGGILPYMGYIGKCRGEGYGFQAVYYEVGYINWSTGWTEILVKTNLGKPGITTQKYKKLKSASWNLRKSGLSKILKGRESFGEFSLV